MDFTKLLRLMHENERAQVQRVIDTLKFGGRSDKTILNYVHAINRFLKYFKYKNIQNINESDIIEYISKKYLNKSSATNTYNMNVCAIKFFYSVNFNKTFNNKLLPHAKLAKRLPVTIDKDIFLKIFNSEYNLNHKCWLLLAYYSGLRVNEIASLRIEDIFSNEHKLKVFGKRSKERFTVLTDITIKYLRLYYKTTFHIISKDKQGYLFEGISSSEHINSKTISNYFTHLKFKYDLDDNITFHSLRHSFATNFISSGGDAFVLKSMLGHSSLNTTSIYVHMGRDFNNLKGVNYDGF